MLVKIVVSSMFLMGLSACVMGAICLGIGVKESYKDSDWPGFFGMLGILMLMILMGALLICGWVLFLVSGSKTC